MNPSVPPLPPPAPPQPKIDELPGGAIQVDMPVSGAAVFWNLGNENDYEKFEQVLNDHGFGQFVPERRSDPACLKSAMSRVFGGSGVLIRPLEDSEVNGFTAVREEKGTVGNDYTTLCAARLDDAGQIEIVQGEIPESKKLFLAADYLYQKSILTQAQVAKTLVKIITDTEGLNGDPLKPSGGIYWLGAKQLERWDKLAAAVETISTGRRNTLYTLRVIYDNNSVKALKDAIEREVALRAQEIESLANQDGLGENAYKNRMSDAQRLHDRIAAYRAMYADMLGDTLGKLDKLADKTETNVLDAACRALPDIFSGKD